jgi:hypothetical protein
MQEAYVLRIRYRHSKHVETKPRRTMPVRIEPLSYAAMKGVL